MRRRRRASRSCAGGLPVRATSLLGAILTFAFALSCGSGNGDRALREPAQEDLPNMTIQVEDLADGFEPVTVCEHQNPSPTTDASTAVAFYEQFDEDSQEGILCVVSFVWLLQSVDEASRSIGSLDEFFAQYFEPIEGVAAECAVFREVDAPRVGEESRVFTTDCASCPGEVAQFYWIQFRVGRVLASPRLIGDECRSLSEAIVYATKQKERIEAVLRTDASD